MDEKEEVEELEEGYSEAWDEAVGEKGSAEDKDTKESRPESGEEDSEDDLEEEESDDQDDSEVEEDQGEEEEHDWQARYEDLQKGLNRKISEQQQEINRLQTQNRELASRVQQKQDILEIFADELDEDTREAIEERPELRKMFNLMLRKMTPEPEKSAPAKESIEVPTRATAEQFDKTMALKYPNWPEIVQSETFQTWIGKQPKELQLIYHQSSDPLEAVKVLDSYQDHVRKAKLGEDHDRRKDAMRGSVTKSGTSRAGAGTKTPDPDDYDAAWEEATAGS